MTDEKGNEIEVANKAKQIFYLKLDKDVKPGYLLRKEI